MHVCCELLRRIAHPSFARFSDNGGYAKKGLDCLTAWRSHLHPGCPQKLMCADALGNTVEVTANHMLFENTPDCFLAFGMPADIELLIEIDI